MSSGARTPVVLLTGALGAGKTTALNRWLADPFLARTLVLVNEVGAIPVDHLIVREAREDVVVLASGCVCCSVRADLRGALGAVDREAIDRIVIETTGAADPTPVVATLLSDPLLRGAFALDRIVTVADAERGTEVLQRFVEARKQVALADVLLVSKNDRCDDERSTAFARSLGDGNTLARVLRAETATAAHVLTEPITRSHESPTAPIGARRLPLALEGRSEERSLGGGVHAPPNAHVGLETASLTFDEPVSLARFELWLGMIARFHGDYLLRAKAAFRAKEDGSIRVLQSVQHNVYPSQIVHEPRDPRGVTHDRLGAVFIASEAPPGVLDSLVTSARELAAAER